MTGGRSDILARGKLGKAVVAAITLAVLLLGFLGFKLYQDALAFRASPQDNVQWTVSRLEVEALRLQNSLLSTETPVSAVRKRFDVFYSRVGLLQNGDLFAALRTDPEFAARLTSITGFLNRATPLIDGDEAELSVNRRALAAEIEDVRDDAAALALRANTFFTAAATVRVAAFERLVLGVAGLTAALILILAATLLVLTSRSRLAAKKQREAATSAARLEAIAEVALDPIIVADAEGRVVEYNKAAERVFGYSRAEALGAKMTDLFIPPEMREAHEAGMERYLRHGDPHVIGAGRLELEALRKSGERFPVELAVGEAREGTGGAPIFVGFLRDISRRKEIEAELTSARDAAMAADNAKSRFIAVMSHEMRTPLNGVLGILDLLSGTDLDVRQAEYVDVATTSGEILLRHINDVLDITRIEAGRIEIQQEPMSIEALLAEVSAVGRPGAAARGTTIAVETTGLPPSLTGDAHRIRQVLLNLVGNAVKFTENGTIRIAAERIGGSATSVQIEFSVTDDGVGIKAEDQERIFDDFVTLDAEYTREASGSGLGLSICRRVVAAMGGTIGVESEPGKGSRFWIRLHLQAAARDDKVSEPENEATEATAPGAPLSVLLVEDNEVNRLVAGRMLEIEGHSVTEARDGAEGVAAAAHEKFDVILMDISMPRMDGVEATRRILATGANSETPIIGLTAHVSPTEHADFIEAGMSRCITKPLRRGDLKKVLAAHGGSATERAAYEDADPPTIDEEVFDEFSSTMPAEMILCVARELAEAANELSALEGERLTARAHSAAGSAALVGASRAHRALSIVEATAKTGRRDDVEIEKAKAALEEVAHILREFAG